MARKLMITRTIKTTVATVLCLDVEKAESFNYTVELVRTYKDEKHLMKAIREKVDTEDVKAVHIVSVDVKEALYGMHEDDFIKHAKELPPRTKEEK